MSVLSTNHHSSYEWPVSGWQMDCQRPMMMITELFRHFSQLWLKNTSKEQVFPLCLRLSATFYSTLKGDVCHHQHQMWSGCGWPEIGKWVRGEWIITPQTVLLLWTTLDGLLTDHDYCPPANSFALTAMHVSQLIKIARNWFLSETPTKQSDE